MWRAPGLGRAVDPANSVNRFHITVVACIVRGIAIAAVASFKRYSVEHCTRNAPFGTRELPDRIGYLFLALHARAQDEQRGTRFACDDRGICHGEERRCI